MAQSHARIDCLPLPPARRVPLDMRGSLIFLPLLAACYTHAPIEPGALHSGMIIRARVSASTAEQIEPLLGLNNARVLSGVVITTSPDTLIVEVPTTVRTEIRSSIQTLKQRVAIPRVSILELETRRIDRLRTGLVIGSASALVGGLIYGVVHGSPGDDRPPGPEPREFRFSFLRIRM